jgi:hypothetical protein
MKNHYVLVLSIFGLLYLNHAARAMEVDVLDRSDRTVEYMMTYRALTNGELLRELKKLELQLAKHTGTDFAGYANQQDKINFLYNALTHVGDVMPADMFYSVQKIIAILSIIKYRAYTDEQLQNELNNLELQLQQFLSADDFAHYVGQSDKISFLYNELTTMGHAMPMNMFRYIQKIIAVLFALQAKHQRESTFWSESE